MKMLTMVGLVLVGLCTQGCDMDSTQSAALIGALGTGLIGSQLGDSSDRTRNALIGTAIGAAGGYFVGKNKQNQQNCPQQYCPQQQYYPNQTYRQPTYQQPRYQKKYYTREEVMQMEMERLRRENEQLREQKEEKKIINLDESI